MEEELAHRNLCFAESCPQSRSPLRYRSPTIGCVGQRGAPRQIAAVPQLFNVSAKLRIPPPLRQLPRGIPQHREWAGMDRNLQET